MRGRIKYYFRKPKGEIAKDLLSSLLVAGIVIATGSSSYFISRILQNLAKRKGYKFQSLKTAFYRFRREGMLVVEQKGHQYEIRLTEKGRKKAGWLQIDALKIKRPKTWDQKWRLLMFDVKQKERWKRDVLRSFLRRLQFVQFQKSVWVHAFDCRAELELLQEFLGLNLEEMKLVVAPNIGKDGEWLQKRFGVSY